MKSLKNWDNKTWLSSKKYIHKFNNFLIKQQKLDKNSRLLDIGCGRAKIMSGLSDKLKLINKPIGLDIESHKDKSKKIIFKKIDAMTFVSKTKTTFDLILIKQTIHFLKINQIIKLLSICKTRLKPKGKIIILSLEPKKIEIPSFSLMNKKLKKSLKRDRKIFDLIIKTYPNLMIKNFIFNVEIKKKFYLKMVKNKYISILLNITDKQLQKGLNEINSKYKDDLKFNDRLICLILGN